MNIFCSFVLLFSLSAPLVFTSNCNVDQRVGCGFIGINEATCTSSSYNCCWDESVAPYCYESASPPPPSSSPVPPPSSSSPVPPPSSSGNSYTQTFTFNGGVSFCSQCGENGQYACSDKSNWNGNSLVFTDATPPGYVVTKVEVTLLGSFACLNSNVNDVQVMVNSERINILSMSPTYQCACSTCDGSVLFSSENPYGMTFNLTGRNTLSISSLYNVVCLNSATMKVTFSKDLYGLIPIYKKASTYTGASRTVSPGQCGSTSYYQIYSTYSATYAFSDPLPKGSILVSATFDLYGRFFPYCEANQTITVSMGLAPALTQFLERTTPTSPINTNICQNAGCDGYWRFPQNTLYQNGWPGYNYGSTNYITIKTAEPSNFMDIAFVDVHLWYIPFSK